MRRKRHDFNLYWPYPEVIDPPRGGQGWTVESTETEHALTSLPYDVVSGRKNAKELGATDVDNKILFAPVTGGDCPHCGLDHLRNIRNHEMVHAKFSPDEERRKKMVKKGDPKKRSFQEELIEEIRVTHLVGLMGMDKELGCGRELYPDTPDLWAVSLLVATIGTKEHPQLRKSWETILRDRRRKLASNERKVKEAVEYWEGEVDRLTTQEGAARLSAAAARKSAKAPEATPREKVQADEADLRVFNLRSNLNRTEEELDRSRGHLEDVRRQRKAADTALANATKLMKVLDSEHKRLPKELNRDEWENGKYDYRWTMRVARKVKHLFPFLPDGRSPNLGGRGMGSGGERPGECAASALAPKLAKSVVNESPLSKYNKRFFSDSDYDWQKIPRSKPNQVDGEVQWGEAQIALPPLTVETAKKEEEVIKVTRAVQEGAVLRNPHRWAADRAVFGRRRVVRKVDTAKSGTVLIDVSGSMNWDKEELTRLITTIPAGVVATYSGKDSGYSGVITVVAADGARVDFDKVPVTSMGGNLIDGPALEWLGNQREPRIWVSDGWATSVDGVGDAYAEAEAIRARIGAYRVGDIARAIKRLEDESK